MAPHSRPAQFAAVAVLVALSLSACVEGTKPQGVAFGPDVTVRSTTTTTAAPTTTTTLPAPLPTPPVAAAGAPAPPLPGFGQGANGPEVMALEKRLAELRYDVGNVDGRFDATTHHAVMAFQKVQDLPRTARATPDVMAALPAAAMPAALLPTGGADRVEIDLRRQVLFLWQAGQLVRTLSVSTGTGKRYCVDGECAKAVTPGGSFRVTRKIKGLRVSRLGKLYNPLYFNGGIAIHGSGSVPAGPASHGCVRIPMSASLWFHQTVPSGTPVYVVGGVKAPVPFGEMEPGEDPAATTTLPPATAPPTTTAPVPETTTTTTQPTSFLPTQATTTTTTTTPTTAPPVAPSS
ncbi:MAG TPA: L,D-transpeptidase family protein [Acidimicrobiales bacterium]|nr:L,D-transpeptidase family protein [Acidimicrobiales bacterium]